MDILGLYLAFQSPNGSRRAQPRLRTPRTIWRLKCKIKAEDIHVKSILVVEDSKLLRHANQRALTRAGYTVFVACDGEEALRMAREESHDLILLDMMLPKLSGPEVLSALRANPSTAEVPVIVLSGLS